ncbi:MAG: methyltransferase [Actinomycetota bacterium]|nr:acetylserotonin O-methyltransferase [Actinomycetota bacterium]
MRDDPDKVLEIFLSFWISRTVMAAVEMGVFEELHERTGTVKDVQSRLGIEERPARALLDTCVSVGLLERDEEGYKNSSLGDAFLWSDSEYSLRNYVLDERWCWNAWERLEEGLRTNAQTTPPDATGYHQFPEDFFLDFLHGHSLAMGERMGLVTDITGVKKIMDVGGGSGAVSIALCRRNQNLQSVVVDQAPVVTKAAQHIERAGLSDRIATHAANVFEDVLPAGCDGAVIANFFHDFSPERNRLVLQRVYQALPPGGRVFLLEIVPDDDRTGPPLAVVFSAAMIVNTAAGDAYTAAEYRAWLEEAGFTDVHVTSTQGRMVTAVIEAHKPS